MRLVPIPAGTFLMGSPMLDESPQHKVAISKAFYMGMYSVTQEQWKAIMDTEPWKGNEYVKVGTDYPATYVSWDDAVQFCNKLSRKVGKTVRLPTEGEWEYACRAGTKTRFYYGDDDDYARLSDYAWYEENASDANEKYAHAVGQKRPNAWGLFDMHGNVYEWCSDFLDLYAMDHQADPSVSADLGVHVMRGGCWGHLAGACRSAARGYEDPIFRSSIIGFRAVVEVK